MKKLAFYAFSLLLSVVVLEANAQTSNAQSYGTLMERGFGASIGYSSADQMSQFDLGVGYVFNPMFEAGLSVSRAEDDQSQFTLLGIGPSVDIYPVRQSNSMPLSMRIGADYTFQSFSGDALDVLEALGVDMNISGNAYRAGGALFRSFAASPKVQIIPSGEVGYLHQEVKAEVTEDGQTESASESDGAMYYSVGSTMQFASSPTSTFAITPSVTYSNEEFMYSFSVSMGLPR